MDPSALFAALDNPVPTSTWTVSKNQPLEMVLMAKTDLDTVKTFYEFHPEALTKGLFCNVLKCGAKPGVVGFLASKCPDLVNAKALCLAVAQGPRPDRPTESEIMALANVNPKALAPKSPNYHMSNFLRILMQWKYSQELTQNLFKMSVHKKVVLLLDWSLPDYHLLSWVDYSSNMKRSGIDMAAVLGMTPVLDSKDVKHLVSWGVEWDMDAFSEFVRRVLSNQSIEILRLELPKLGPDRQKESTMFTTDTFNQLMPKCKIKKILLRLDQNNPLMVSFMESCFVRMPCLQYLNIYVTTDLNSVALPISHYLCSDPALERMTIRATSDKTALGLDLILNALTTNQTLERFHYYRDGVQTDKFQRYHNMLAGILQESNTTLCEARFCDGCTKTNPVGIFRSPLHPSQHLLPFYTHLNRLGRKKVYDPATTKADFVKLLVTVTQVKLYVDRNGEDPATKDDTLNIVYGLLQENPTIWSNIHHDPPSSPECKMSHHCGSKRKYSAIS
ncbi:expressed unknown protein [Seminavis robusta]|uniref:Uncharacterized protein n=1 Tax=Seminavis robusta TaxID=568900 RepID=A0A9N8DXK6_9STRA|nr:expressed unknown protein [Seminavis robusta]|eukprot:Sro446_g144681.1  (503) ;mRNA; r:38346-39854